ncbi:fumarylacetoacetate hydrolase family protein [Shimia ponticola]|uniref:fumarylacetoacetate hydrolase family protein n=1 Tax=Shimia ponticola TaxID=2582893 RepID=UPI0011BEED15|nr:fumarylacetoacetate hydrolase family protein [Shimia ponticola]
MRVATVPELGGLMIVDAGHETCVPARQTCLQSALVVDDFRATSSGRHEFDPAACAAPLLRSHTFLDGSAYVNHVDLVRRARGAEMPKRFWTDPLMYQGCAVFDGPTTPITGDAAWGIDFEAEVAVITGDVPAGASPDDAASAVRLITILNDVSLRGLIPDELSKGFGFVQSKPPSALAPIAVTPDDLPGWDGRKLNGTMCVDLNGSPFGRTQTGEDMTFDFGQLIAHAAKTRPLPAGTVIGSGTISNRDASHGPGAPVAEGGRGYSCIAEQRMVETLTTGSPKTPFLTQGDHVEIWFEDADGNNAFGTISQKVETT